MPFTFSGQRQSCSSSSIVHQVNITAELSSPEAEDSSVPEYLSGLSTSDTFEAFMILCLETSFSLGVVFSGPFFLCWCVETYLIFFS